MSAEQRVAGQPESATRKRILEVALNEFGAHGVEEVSVRQITDLAEASSAAISYHFGSKYGLVEYLLRRRAEVVSAHRREMLDALDPGRPPTVRELARILVEPAVAPREINDELEESGTNAAFLSRVASHPKFQGLLNELYETENVRLRALIDRCVPSMPEPERTMRWSAVKFVINHGAADPNSAFIAVLRIGSAGTELDVEVLIDIVADILAGDARGGDRG